MKNAHVWVNARTIFEIENFGKLYPHYSWAA
jgi:hypothetical protein